MCPHLSSALSKFKCLAAKHSCLNPLWTYFLVTCPRLDPNDGITARGCAWMSPEEIVVVFVQCYYTDVAKTSISNFRLVGTVFFVELPQATPICSSAATLARFYHAEIFWLVGESQYQVCTSYRLLCGIGSEMNYQPNLKLHDATLTDQ